MYVASSPTRSELAQGHPADGRREARPSWTPGQQQIEHAQEDQANERALALTYGYRDVAIFRRIRWTFRKYWGKAGGGRELRCFAWKEPEFSQALMG